MSKKFLVYSLTLGCLVAVLAPAVAQAQTCEPLDDGRLANVFYEGTALFFEPVVEYRQMVLTITGPCEDIVRTFGPKDTISFDIREIERVVDGTYTWQLRRVAADPGLEEELQSLRGSGKEDAVWWDYFQSGKIPEGPYVDSSSFTVVRGQIIDPSSGEEKSATLAGKGARGGSSSAIQTSLAGGATAGESGDSGEPVLATKDFVINDDLIVIGSTCIGFDCVNGEVFGFDTLRFRENNTRIQFNDTSSSSSFPTTNWQIRANSSANGGESFLGFMDQGAGGDSESGTRVFAVEAGAGSNALFVESGGDVGVGTGNPVLNLHVVDGDTPALRLEQDGSSGFQPQVWDLAGNETSFFVRDATNGSTLPFRIFPGSSSNSLIVRDGDVGIGTTSPGTFTNSGDDAAVHVRRTSASQGGLLIERATGSAASDVLLELRNNGTPRIDMVDSGSGTEWRFEASGAGFNINDLADAGSAELVLQTNGDLIIEGSLTVGPGGCTGCDLVFSPEYPVESIEEHAAYMWQNRHLPGVGPTPEDQPMNLSQKTGGILNELEKAHIYIEQLHSRLVEREGQLEELATENDTLEQRLGEIEALMVSRSDG